MLRNNKSENMINDNNNKHDDELNNNKRKCNANKRNSRIMMKFKAKMKTAIIKKISVKTTSVIISSRMIVRK